LYFCFDFKGKSFIFESCFVIFYFVFLFTNGVGQPPPPLEQPRPLFARPDRVATAPRSWRPRRVSWLASISHCRHRLLAQALPPIFVPLRSHATVFCSRLRSFRRRFFRSMDSAARIQVISSVRQQPVCRLWIFHCSRVGSAPAVPSGLGSQSSCVFLRFLAGGSVLARWFFFDR
jgi:hypothetical protein